MGLVVKIQILQWKILMRILINHGIDFSEAKISLFNFHFVKMSFLFHKKHYVKSWNEISGNPNITNNGLEDINANLDKPWD